MTRRPDSTVWGFVLRAPQDLRHRFNGKPWAVRCSLATSDLRQANDKARALHAEWADRFAAMRREEHAQPAVQITPGMATLLAERVATKVLQDDERMRKDPKATQGLLGLMKGLHYASLSPLAIGKPQAPPLSAAFTAELDPWEGLPAELADFRAELHLGIDSQAALSLGRQRVTLVESRVLAEARALGFTFTRTTPGALEAMRACLTAYRQAAADVVRRDVGEVVETPTQAQPQAGPQGDPGSTQATKQGHTPKDAFEAWEKLKADRPTKTLNAYRSAADKLAELLDGRPLEAMTQEDGRAFVATLKKEAAARGPKGVNTAVNILSRWKTLLSQAVDLEWVDKNRFDKRTIERVATDRDEWSPHELVKLFDDPLFTVYNIPSASMAGRDAAYWLPLLGLFTGARISELAQLGINDVLLTQEAGWVLSIHEDEEGHSVKNAGAVRQVPIHPELVRLGLIDYWQTVKDLGATRLWPAVVFTDLNGAGGKVSQWFGKFKADKGFGPDRVFHSFRHTLQTRLLALGVPESHADTLAGRAGKSVSRRSYTHLKPADVRPSLERLQFPGLTLPRVFKVPAWKPKKA